MQNHAAPVQPRRNLIRPLPDGATRIALDENELAARWGSPSKPCAAGGRNNSDPSSASSGRGSPT